MDDFDFINSANSNSDYTFIQYNTGNDLLDIYINQIITFISQNIIIFLALFVIIQIFYGLILQRYFKSINCSTGTWKCFFPFIRFLDFYRISGVNQLFAVLIIGFIVPYLNFIIVPVYYIVLNYVIYQTISTYQNNVIAIKAILFNIFIPFGLPIYLLILNRKAIF
ncbi:hypothetical protein OKW22_001182 [Bacilli bacterium PM5-3]|nr:hypothetical protein [Bacilli bacterium PM5-3]MDH6602921.1 hypothetical protein [Bacilli bacterium PM5-9]